MKLPYIFIFDIDNTIIGDINHQIIEYKLLKNINTLLLKDFDITDVLNNGMLRPYFKDFIDFIYKKYKNVEIYVYTNSSFEWINYGLIDNIQKSINYKINKPYFTKDDTNYKKKLLGNIYDNIINSLIAKYPSLKSQKNKELVFKNQIVFIDDINNNLKDYPQKQILCPEYTYIDVYDMKNRLINKYNITEDVFDKEIVLSLFENEYLPLYNKNGSIYQQDKSYQELLRLRLLRKQEINNINDTFFKNLISILDEDKTLILNDNTIKNINDKLNNIKY